MFYLMFYTFIIKFVFNLKYLKTNFVTQNTIFLKIFLFKLLRTSHLYVDDPQKGSDKVPVMINIELPKMKCECK